MDPILAARWATGILLTGLVVLLNWLYYRWARRRLEAWARESRIDIRRCQWRLFLRGPYDALGKYAVFRIVAADPSGSERVGWVRLGSFWLGLMTDESHVVWERDP